MERRLAAIVLADIVGYSHLMGDDEVGTLTAVAALRSAPSSTRRRGPRRAACESNGRRLSPGIYQRC